MGKYAVSHWLWKASSLEITQSKCSDPAGVEPFELGKHSGLSKWSGLKFGVSVLVQEWQEREFLHDGVGKLIV